MMRERAYTIRDDRGRLGWTLDRETGEYRASFEGDWTLEKRRAEAGDPAGWYLFPPGLYMASSSIREAVTVASSLILA